MIPSLDPKPTIPVEPLRVSAKVTKVLLVDDALAVRRKLSEILHRSGIHASDLLTATEPEAAMELFVREHPAIVFAELVGDSPDVGLDMVSEMLQLDPQVRIVLVTGEDPQGAIVRRAVRLGVFAVVPKPLRHEKVRAVLQEIDSEDGGVERFR